MELSQSQLDYLKNRGSNYDRKYRMFEIMLDKIPYKLDNVLELFGGVGIQSWYLQNIKDIVNHVSIDMDDDCNAISNKMLPNVNRLCIDSFSYEDADKVALLVHDSVFNNKEFNNVVELVNKFDFDNLILTNTGVFHVRFDKSMTYEKYWDCLIDQLAECGLLVSDVVYSTDFGMMLIRKSAVAKASVCKLAKGDVSKDWRKYVDEVYSLENI